MFEIIGYKYLASVLWLHQQPVRLHTHIEIECDQSVILSGDE